MMKKLFVFLMFFFSMTALIAQVLDPVDWSSKVTKISDTEYELIYTANIDEHWHFYSQITDDESGLGPIATEFAFNNSEGNYELIGTTSESEVVQVFEEAFQMDVRYFEDEAIFKQKIKVLNPNVKVIDAEVFYQCCDDKKCLSPVTFEFKTSLAGEKVAKTNVSIDEASKIKSEALYLDIKGKDKFIVEEVKRKSYLGIFILGFLGGLIALLTPCVFPMIPLTVSFFTKSGSNTQKGLANAMLYGFFILLIYVLLSLPFHIFDSLNPEILNTISTNVGLNIFFFIILAFFAFSFFGFYEITLPASWGNRMDAASSRIGGVIGIFFMALTLAIVSFSCTGPILGSLLAGSLSSDGGAMQLTMGMSGFGLALALPFTLFAMFPKLLNSLPKSGGWLNTTKVILGFLELALAFKFLSNADLVKHWGLLKREVFVGIWIVIGIGLLLYLLGKIKFPHDGPFKKISFSRWSFIILVGAFVVYLIPGVMKHPIWNLNLLSGFPPPMSYSVYHKEEKLTIFQNMDEGVAYAEEHNKPIMIDFTGWACVNCREMEERVWTTPLVEDLLQNDYVIISLYVDDREDLPVDEQFKFQRKKGGIKSIKTIGDKWATFQTINFQNNSQPFYVLLDSDFNLLNVTKTKTDADDYYNWLKLGLENFNK